MTYQTDCSQGVTVDVHSQKAIVETALCTSTQSFGLPKRVRIIVQQTYLALVGLVFG